MIRVLVADDQFVVREGIKILLEPMEEIQIVGFAENGREVLELVPKEAPDIILLDIEMPDIDGLTLTKQISCNYPSIKIIILSTHLRTEYVTKALDFGAKGYIYKSAVTQDLSLSIQLVYRGYSSIKHELVTQVLNHYQQKIIQYQEYIETLKYQLKKNHNNSKNQKKILSLIEFKNYIMTIFNPQKNVLQTINKGLKSFFKYLYRILFHH